MRYYIAEAIPDAPFLIFSLVAESLEELVERGLQNDPLVVDEYNIPRTDYNICYATIDNGALIDRLQIEIDNAIDLYNAEQTAKQKKVKLKEMQETELLINTYTRAGWSTVFLEGEFHKIKDEYNLIN